MDAQMTGHVSLLLLLVSIEHAASFAMLEKKVPSSRLALLDSEELSQSLGCETLTEDTLERLIFLLSENPTEREALLQLRAENCF